MPLLPRGTLFLVFETSSNIPLLAIWAVPAVPPAQCFKVFSEEASMAFCPFLKSAYKEPSIPPNRVTVTFARPNFPYSTWSTQPGIQRLLTNALWVSFWI